MPEKLRLKDGIPHIKVLVCGTPRTDSYLGPPSSLLIINDLLLPDSEQNIQLRNWFGPY